MPRQRIHHRRDPLELPDDFSERLRRFQQESRMSWSETARRWFAGRARPDKHGGRALPELADGMALGHLFTDNGDRA